MPQRAEGPKVSRNRRSASRSGKATRVSGAKRPSDPQPKFIPPCLATLYSDVARGEQWTHEIKFDGYRLQARIEGDDVRLLTRTGLDWTPRFKTVAKALAGLKLKSAILDGEVVVEDDAGASSFVKLVEALKSGGSTEMVYYAFDVLYLEGLDVTAAPLEERRALLETALERAPERGVVRFSQHLEGDARRIFAEACKLGLEGIISKRRDMPYRSGRRDEWRKTKCIHTDEFVIGGYVDHAKIKKAIGSLALGYFDNGAFVYAGRVGTGFDQETAAALWKALQPLRRGAPAFDTKLDALQRRGVMWVEPQLVAQIEYRAWSADNILRHAAFTGLREDKPAKSVSRPKL